VAQALSEIAVVDHYGDKLWRLWNLYYIINEHGERVKFQPTWVQENLYAELWFLNLIPKARQVRITTAVDLWILDDSLFNSNLSGAIIADGGDKAKEIFGDKIKYPYENLPLGLRQARYLEKEQAQGFEFDNGSSIMVGVSVRGLTFQNLHISELARIDRYFPDKSEEIRTGALNTVHAGQCIFVESTTQGREGLFADLCERALHLKQEGRALTPLDFKIHFYPWYVEPTYTLSDEDAAKITLTEVDDKYFDELEASEEIELTRGQRAWYVVKRETQGAELMKREFPSTIKEAFEASGEGFIFQREMAKVRTEGRILERLPVIPTIPVNVFFDLGGASTRAGADFMSLWFHQRVGPENRLLRYYENSGYGLEHYVNYIRSHGYLIGKLYLPHDAEHKRLVQRDAGQSVVDILYGMGLRGTDVVVVEIVQNKWHDGIGSTRSFLSTCVFDKRNCEQGIKRLDSYKKTWNDKLGCWRDEPAHDDASHGADALETGARGFNPPATTTRPRKGRGRRNYRTV